MNISMIRYKRNQIEEAVSRLLESKAKEPSSEITTRLKRLLDTDRGLGRSVRSSDPRKSHYAFYSAEAPGTGVEIWFSAYEAFALLTGLRLMQHGWTQGFAVSLMREVRPGLEREHAKVLKLDPKEIFDADAIASGATPGDFGFDTTVPLLLVIVSESGTDAGRRSTAPIAAGLFGDSHEAGKFGYERSGGRGGWTMFELTKIAHAFAGALNNTEPRHRGRGS